MRFPHIILLLFWCPVLWAQQTLVKGVLVTVYDAPLPNCRIELLGSSIETYSDEKGFFSLTLPLQFVQGELLINTPEGRRYQIPIKANDQDVIDLGFWKIEPAYDEQNEQTSWEALLDEDKGLDREQIGSVLQSQRDVFLNTVAFQFSPTFFRLRGLDPGYQEVLLNGISMRSFFKGSPQWSQWGGLNDFTNRAQQSFLGNSAQLLSNGGFLSTTKIDLRPSAFRSGGKIAQAFSNSSYRYRTQVSYVQRPVEKKVGYGVLLSYRGGKQGYIEGTGYKAISLALLAERFWNAHHQSWVTFIYTPNERGKSAPLTQEVFKLKGTHYNPYWGYQEGKIRNSRIFSTQTPLLFFNHKWSFSEDHFLQFNMGTMWGKLSSSRLGYNGHEAVGGILQGGGSNPDPVYYQYLPSYALRKTESPDYTTAFLLQEKLLQDGQIQWEELYLRNQTSSGYGIYALYEDVQQLKHGRFNIQHTLRKKKGLEFLSQFSIAKEKATFFATPSDLLGASFLWNYNPYATTFFQAPNDLNSPDRKISIGDPYQYHYDITTTNIDFSSGANYNSSGWSAFGRIGGGVRTYLRKGYFQNGTYPKDSYGVGEIHSFKTFTLKGGVHYAFNGRHSLRLNLGMQQQPPAYKNVFVNPRENQFVVPEGTFEKNKQINLSYAWQAPTLTLKINGYFIKRDDVQEVSYYFADGIGGDTALFVQEITKGIAFKHLGIEGSLEWEILPELRAAGVISYGRFLYDNNPQVYLGTSPTENNSSSKYKQGMIPLGEALLKNYALAGGPQRAFSLSLHYEDPNFWNISVYGNYFSNAYLDPNPLLRTANFYTDIDGLPFADYNPETAQKLLTQEQFPSYFLLNANAGKSWRIGRHYTGFFISLQNLLNTTFITGGFEQGRNANYPSLKEDKRRKTPLFSPKYWWGRGSTFFISTYYRF